MKKFIVFDLDGTLLDTLPDIASSMNRALYRYGLPQHPLESYRAFTGNGALQLSRRAVSGHEEKLESVHGLYLHDYSQNSRVNTRPYPGMADALEQLHAKGIGLIVYSNKDDQDAKDVVAHYFPGIPFLAVLGALPDVPLKPDPEALNGLLEELELDKAKGIYAGDTQMDIQCAKAVGLRSVAVTWGFVDEDVLRKEEPDEVIHQADELLGLVSPKTQLETSSVR